MIKFLAGCAGTTTVVKERNQFSPLLLEGYQISTPEQIRPPDRSRLYINRVSKKANNVVMFQFISHDTHRGG